MIQVCPHMLPKDGSRAGVRQDGTGTAVEAPRAKRTEHVAGDEFAVAGYLVRVLLLEPVERVGVKLLVQRGHLHPQLVDGVFEVIHFVRGLPHGSHVRETWLSRESCITAPARSPLARTDSEEIVH